MFDFHYDLLTQLYISYLNDDFKKVSEFCKSFREDNVKAVLANMCFETEAEMKEDYHPNYWNPQVGLKKMFFIATSLVSKFVPSDIEVYYSIEGCDYVEIEDLEDLYKMGLRSILPVWNHQNQYGSGSRTNEGLTEKGVALIEKAVELGIAIDLSHANGKTFFGMLDVIERLQKEGKKVTFFASHSNVKNLCDRERNLTDDQIMRLVSLGGKIGLLSNRNFVVKNALDKQVSIEELKDAYVKQIQYIEHLTGKIDAIVLSTDDMGWVAISANDPDYAKLAIYPYSHIAYELKEFLEKSYDQEIIYQLLYGNGKQLFSKEQVKQK